MYFNYIKCEDLVLTILPKLNIYINDSHGIRKVLISVDTNLRGEEEWLKKEIKRHISIAHDIFYSCQYYCHCWFNDEKL